MGDVRKVGRGEAGLLWEVVRRIRMYRVSRRSSSVEVLGGCEVVQKLGKGRFVEGMVKGGRMVVVEGCRQLVMEDVMMWVILLVIDDIFGVFGGVGGRFGVCVFVCIWLSVCVCVCVCVLMIWRIICSAFEDIARSASIYAANSDWIRRSDVSMIFVSTISSLIDVCNSVCTSIGQICVSIWRDSSTLSSSLFTFCDVFIEGSFIREII